MAQRYPFFELYVLKIGTPAGYRLRCIRDMNLVKLSNEVECKNSGNSTHENYFVTASGPPGV